MISLLFLSCSESDKKELEQETELKPELTGKGFFTYNNYQPLHNKPIKVYYNIPENANTNTAIVFLFHGEGRNAVDYRDALINKSIQHGFIIMAPEFSEEFYPAGNQYNLGNVYTNGDNPSPVTLNSELIWTFSIIEPLFDFIKSGLINSSPTYHIIGHSAGAQFAHRLIMFKPNGRYNKIVASASGWYTVPNINENFPYGFNQSILHGLSLIQLFNKNLTIQIGSLDNNSNSPGLRRNPIVDLQGTNRLARANYFFNFSQNLATANQNSFQWQIRIIQGLNHDFIPAIQNASDLIFN